MGIIQPAGWHNTQGRAAHTHCSFITPWTHFLWCKLRATVALAGDIPLSICFFWYSFFIFTWKKIKHQSNYYCEPVRGSVMMTTIDLKKAAHLFDAIAQVTQLVVDGLQLFLHVLLAVRQNGQLTAQTAQNLLHPGIVQNKSEKEEIGSYLL